MNKVLFAIALLAGVGALSACSNMKKSLGIENSAPDEFMVTTRAPLTLPPDFDLRPVSSVTAARQEVAPQAVSQAAPQPATFSEGEQALLSKLR